MKTARLWFFLALMAFAPPGCNDSSSDDAPPDLLAITARGGSAVSGSFPNGGANGGDIFVRASGDLRFASAGNRPSAPSIPAAPTSGTELTNAMITAGAPIAGNILVSSTLQIAAGVNPATITTNDGDVVIRASLIGERSAGAATNDISISAPAGTIYVLGSIRTAGSAGAPDNPHGGNISLSALRIVIRSNIDARGLADPSGTGGNGGTVTVDTTGGGGTDVLFTAGSITAMGGNGEAQGGAGGDITLLAGTRLSVFAPVFAQGGSATATAVTAFGGNGGNVTVGGTSGADISASITMRGGAGSGYSQGAMGGEGGDFTADGAGPWRIFGSISTSGGTATAPAAGIASVTGNTAGSVRIGFTTPPTSLDLGRGSYTTSGGSGDDSGGSAGSFDVASLDGDITVGGVLTARGGSGDSTGYGGSVTITTDADVLGNSSNHALTASTSIDTRGGSGTLGGLGGPVLLQSGGDLSFTGEIATSGQGGGGHGAHISLVVDAANLAPTGALTLSGVLESEGFPAGGSGFGNGGDVLLSSFGPLTFSADLSTRSGGGSSHAGSITLQAVSGDIHLSGSISTPSLFSYSSAPTPAVLTVSTAGSIVSDAVIDVSAGFPHPTNSNVAGGDGGTVSFTSTGPGGSITLLAGSEITANGGNSTAGAASIKAGAGGRILFSTVDQAISITGPLTAKGGAAPTTPGDSGGLGGQVVVNSDSDEDGTGGAITLTAGSVIDVSGAAGFDAGDALNNGGVAPADSSGTNLAVVFDAAGGLTASPDGGSEGMVRNLGTIIATGATIVARGGDIWFDGRDGSGGEIGPADGGILTLTGAGGNGVFFPN